jgi:hypothetical protein
VTDNGRGDSNANGRKDSIVNGRVDDARTAARDGHLNGREDSIVNGRKNDAPTAARTKHQRPQGPGARAALTDARTAACTPANARSTAALAGPRDASPESALKPEVGQVPLRPSAHRHLGR